MAQAMQVMQTARARLIAAIGAAIVVLVIAVGTILSAAPTTGSGGQDVIGKPDWSRARPVNAGNTINNGQDDIVCPNGMECGP